MKSRFVLSGQAEHAGRFLQTRRTGTDGRGTEGDDTQKPHTENRVLLRRVAFDLEQHMLSSENEAR